MGPEIIERTVETVDKIHTRIKATQDKQKSYVDTKRKDLEFQVRDKVFLKVALIKGVLMFDKKGVLRFDKKGKLRPHYIGPFEILDRVGNVASRLALPPELAAIYNVFHISMIKKYVHDLDHVVNFQSLEVQKDSTYEESSIKIPYRRVHKLRNKEIQL